MTITTDTAQNALNTLMDMRTEASEQGNTLLAQALSIAWAVQYENMYSEGTLIDDETPSKRAEWFERAVDIRRQYALLGV